MPYYKLYITLHIQYKCPCNMCIYALHWHMSSCAMIGMTGSLINSLSGTS